MFTKRIFIRLIQFIVIILETMVRAQPELLLPNQEVLYDRRVQLEYFASHSPCPQVFEYRYDPDGVHGVVSVHSSVYNSFDKKRIQVKIFFRVEGFITDNQNTGKLELHHDWITTVKMIETLKPIQYRLEFPRHPTTPSVINITVNEQIICINDQPSNMNEMFAIIRLQYGFTLPQKPLIVLPFHTAHVSRERKALLQDKFQCGKIANKFQSAHLTSDKENIGRGTWPWLVGIYLNAAGGSLIFKCTGNLLSNRIVVSAAHCFIQNKKQIEPSKFVLSFGRHILRDWSTNVWDVERIEIPKDYLRRGAFHKNDSDIAILIMQEFIEYSSFIRPICVWPSLGASSNQHSCGIIVGWGNSLNSDEEEIFNVPRKMQMKAVAKNFCLPSSSSAVSQRVICAESITSNGPCKGDSGSGLAIWQNDAWVLRGIVSVAIGDPYLYRCEQNKYVILTDASKFSTWITKWINKFQ